MSSDPWTRIDAWLERHAPAVAESLRPPAAAEDLAEVEAATGCAATPGLEALYAGHDGQREGGLFDRHRFLPLGEALRLRSAFLAAEGVSWEPLWLPLGSRMTGEHLALDLGDDTVRRYGPVQPKEIKRDYGWGVFHWRGQPEESFWFDTKRDQVIRNVDMQIVEWAAGRSPVAMLERLAADLEAGHVVYDADHGLIPTLWLDALEDACVDGYEINPLKRLRKLYRGDRKALRQLRDMAKRHGDRGAGHHLGAAYAGLGKLGEAILTLEDWALGYPGSEVSYTRDGVTTVTRIPPTEEPLVRALLADLRSRYAEVRAG